MDPFDGRGAGIDPAWEFWTPADPEVAEALAAAAACRPFDRLYDARQAGDPGRFALRFGRGDPDGFEPRLAPGRPDARRPDRCRLVRCDGCRRLFKQKKPSQACCSRACRPAPPARAARPPCRRCGKPVPKARRKHCSRACAGAAADPAAPCGRCGRPVGPGVRSNGMPRKYCSLRCGDNAAHAAMNARRAAARPPRPVVACGWCGGPTPAGTAGRPRKYCSERCGHLARNPPPPRPPVPCVGCGRPVPAAAFNPRPRKYCSARCRCRVWHRRWRAKKKGGAP